MMKVLSLRFKDLISQPFNESRDKYAIDGINYRARVRSIHDLDIVLDEIESKYSGYKTFFYQLDEEFNKHMLKRSKYKIIFLHRQNYLKSAVSRYIAEQTKIWTADENLIPQKNMLQSLDVHDIEKELLSIKTDVTKYRSFLESEGLDWIDVVSEHVFSQSAEARLIQVARLFKFLGIVLSSSEEQDVMHYLNPQRKINNDGTYNLVPNIHQIEDIFGSVENGFLFKT